MKKVYFPKIKLREPEKIWLNEIYRRIKNNEEISYKNIRAKLFNDLPVNFNPRTIDKRIAKYGGEEITILGIKLIDPKTDIFEKANKVLRGTKEYLLKNPKSTKIEASEIAKLIKLKESEVGLIFKLASDYGRFFSSASGSNEYHGYSVMDISNDRETFDQYLHFTNIEDLINNYWKEEEAQEQRHLHYNQTVLSNKSSNEIKSDFEFTINPIFRTRVEQIDIKLCFVLMPFTESWSDRVYKNYIRENIESMGLQCLRADNLTGHIIIEDIWTKINQAAFIIADVTNKNANVMYELGIAHTIGKPVILITQDVKNIPFDFTHLRHYEYKDHSDGKELFRDQLLNIVPLIYKDSYPEINASFLNKKRTK